MTINYSLIIACRDTYENFSEVDPVVVSLRAERTIEKGFTLTKYYNTWKL